MFLSPSIKTRELDFSTYALQVSTCILGIVGAASKGELNKPMLITNGNQSIRKLGPPLLDDFGLFGGMQYLDQGNQLYYNRIAGSSVATAEVLVTTSSGSPVVVFLGATPGTWYNGIKAIITDVDQSESTFKLTIEKDGEKQLQYLECDLDPASSNYIETILADDEYLRADDVLDGLNNKLPSAGTYVLSGGHDGIQPRNQSLSVAPTVRLNCNELDDQGNPRVAVQLSWKIAGTEGNGSKAVVSNVNGTGFDLEINDGTVSVAQVVTLAIASACTSSGTLTLTLNGTPCTIELLSTDDTPDKVATKINNEVNNLADYTSILDDNVLTITASVAGAQAEPLIDPGTSGVQSVLTVITPGETNPKVYETYLELSTVPGVDYLINRLSGSKYINAEYSLSYPVTLLEVAGTFTGGQSGSTIHSNGITDSDIIGIGTKGLQAFSNPDGIDINVLAVPGKSSAPVINELLSISSNRGDCISLIDPPIGLEPLEVMDWHNGVNNYSGHQAFNSSYGALYWPWLKVFDPYSSRELWVPPSGFVSSRYAYNDMQGQPWYAPAGLRRARILKALDVEYNSSLGERDAMHGNQNAINAIIKYRKEGITIWGQRTLQRRPSSTDRVNVRRLLLLMRKVISISSAYLLFEQNDEFAWNEWIGMVEPYCSNIASARGLYDYKVVMDATTVTDEAKKRHEMPGFVYLQPTESAEGILIDFVLVPSGAVFPLAAQ